MLNLSAFSATTNLVSSIGTTADSLPIAATASTPASKPAGKPRLDTSGLANLPTLDLGKFAPAPIATNAPAASVVVPAQPLISSFPATSPQQQSQDQLVATSTEIASSISNVPGLQLPDYLAANATPDTQHKINKYQITYELLNAEQRQAVEFAISGKSFCLIGAAGTGKTTTQRMTVQELASTGCVKQLPDTWEHKYITKGNPAILIVSYINKAVNNIRAALPAIFKPCAITIHKALEYAPVYEDYTDLDADGNEITKTRKVFRPQRNATNPIVGITHIVVEESSTVDLRLFAELIAALPNHKEITWIFLGDIKQLPPVMGSSVLADKLQELPVTELTQVYRTANDSPIKKLAIAINDGLPISDQVLREEYHKAGELEIVNLSGVDAAGKGKPRRGAHEDFNPIINNFKNLLQSGTYVPFRDIILCPYRQHDPDNLFKWINTEHINLHLADFHGKLRNETVHEVIAGFNRKYLAIGDPVVLNKREFQIIDIAVNPKYQGIPCKLPSPELSRWGEYHGAESQALHLGDHGDVTALLDMTVVNLTKTRTAEEDEEIRKTPSHILQLQRMDDPENPDDTIEVTTAGDINSIDFAYATSIHKSIGSEWERVYLVLHHSMVRMMFRELLYTAVTRARTYLQIITNGQNHQKAAPNSSLINCAILNPRIKGVTLAEKLAWLRAQKDKESAAEYEAEQTANLLAGFATKK